MDKDFLAYIPEKSKHIVEWWLSLYNVKVRLTSERATKLGDYKPPSGTVQALHRISLNRNLNPYALIIIFVHEYAHLQTWVKYKNRVKPHGEEWNNAFKELLYILLDKEIFPEDIEMILKEYVFSKKSKSSVTRELNKKLEKYNTSENSDDKGILLEEIPAEQTFKIYNGMIFRKGQKLRTRYKCQCLTNKRWYYIDGMMRVFPCSVD